MNKTKIILFDVDGVLIKLPHYFSKELEKQGYENVQDCMTLFHHSKENLKCLEGIGEVENTIRPYLDKFGWKGSTEEYLKKQYDYESGFLDKDLMREIEKLRKRNINCMLCTDQDKRRAKFLLENLSFSNIFDGYFISCYIGSRKCDKNFWQKVIKDLKKEFPGLKPDEIVFVDDIQNNINAALAFGIRSFLYTGLDQFKKDIIFNFNV